jgi:hypothetical protein
MSAATFETAQATRLPLQPGVCGESFGAVGRNFNCHPRRLAQPPRH